MEYKSKGGRYENLSPKEYLNMIRPYLRDLIHEHKPIAELNNNNNTAEQKIQLIIQNSCISTRSFEKSCTIYIESEALEIFMRSDTNDVTDKLFNTKEKSNKRGSEFIPDSVELLYHHFQRIDIIRAESYIMSPDWIASKKATINPKNEKDNKCFQYSIISGLNHNKIKEKELKKILKFRVDTDFSLHQRELEEFEQNNTLIALNILFVAYNSEQINLHIN